MFEFSLTVSKNGQTLHEFIIKRKKREIIYNIILMKKLDILCVFLLIFNSYLRNGNTAREGGHIFP